ncbi:choice-of-anchor tandem repeat GloVer-containing protein, partial [Ideonella azotifigens]
GGSADVGTVYRVALDGSFTQLHSFDTTSPAGYAPYDRLTPAPDGSLYGTTWHGPAGASGTVFRIQP